LVVAVAVFGMLAAAVVSSKVSQVPAAKAPEVTVKKIGKVLMDPYVLPLEVAGLLLTAAMIGAVIIARNENEKNPK